MIVYDMGLIIIWGDVDSKMDRSVGEAVVATREAN